MPDPASNEYLIAFAKRMLSMQRQTSDAVVNFYWQASRDFGDGYLPFVLIGGLEWTAQERRRLYSSDQMVWMKAAPTEEEDPNRIPTITTHDRQISAGVKAEVNPDNANEARKVIREAITQVTLLADLLALTFDTPVQWYPARYLGGFPVSDPSELQDRDVIPVSRSAEAMTNTNIESRHIETEILPLFSAVADLGDSAFSLVLRTAINWHAQGYAIQAGLSQYLSYWASIELLGTFLYDHLPETMAGRRSKAERQKAVLDLLRSPITEKDCLALVDKLSEIRRPTVRTKVLVLSHWVADRNTLEKRLFTRRGGYSLYQIRNDIAHGNVGLHHHDFLEVVRDKLNDMRGISRYIITALVREAPRILPLLQRTAGNTPA